MILGIQMREKVITLSANRIFLLGNTPLSKEKGRAK
jgi:hypothetical protein